MCQHLPHLLSCMLCAPLFNSLTEARIWMVHNASKRLIKTGASNNICEQSAATYTDQGYLLFMMVYGPIVAWVRTCSADHYYQSSARVGKITCRL